MRCGLLLIKLSDEQADPHAGHDDPMKGNVSHPAVQNEIAGLSSKQPWQRSHDRRTWAAHDRDQHGSVGAMPMGGTPGIRGGTSPRAWYLA